MENNEKNNPLKFDWADKKVLIAEDEVMNYLYLEEALRDTGITVVWCKNGLDAVEKVTVEKVKFDVILMDIKMPKMNGYDATEIIKKHNPNIPIIIQTAFAMPEERTRGFEAGGSEYLEKPIRQNTLLTVLNNFIK